MRAFAFFIAIFCATAVLLNINNTLAQDKSFYPIGQIAALEGKAFYVRGEKRKKLKLQDPIYLNTVIETDPGGKALILFIDDTQLVLAEKTRLKIDEFVFDPYDPEENHGEFDVTKGAFHWLSGMLSKRDRPDVKITTSVGTIGIRGTEFWAGNVPGGYGVFVDSGLVNFDGAWGSADIPAGQNILIKDASSYTLQDEYWTAETRNAALLRTTFTKDEGLEKRLEELREGNIRKRHDYRGQIFPYKPNPLAPTIAPEDDEFFSGEFIEMKDKHR